MLKIITFFSSWRTLPKWQLLLIGGSLIVVDQLSKEWASTQGWLIFNQGASFGWGNQLPPTVMLVSTMVISLLAVWQIWQTQGLAAWGWLGIAAGGFANALDRWQWQAVRDWLPIPGTALHNNVADYLISLGVIGLLWAWWQQSRRGDYDGN